MTVYVRIFWSSTPPFISNLRPVNLPFSHPLYCPIRTTSRLSLLQLVPNAYLPFGCPSEEMQCTIAMQRSSHVELPSDGSLKRPPVPNRTLADQIGLSDNLTVDMDCRIRFNSACTYRPLLVRLYHFTTTTIFAQTLI